MDYIPVSTNFISSFIDPLPFNVYIERADGIFTNIYKKNSNQDEQQIERYRQKNVQYLYINKKDKNDYCEFLLTVCDKYLLEKEQFIEMFKAGLELNYEHVDFDNEELDVKIKIAMQNVKSSILLLESDVKMAIEIFKALANSSQLLKHSYMVSIFSILLAKELEFSSQRMLLSIGLGGLLHDIGLTRIDNQLLTKLNLSSKEWEEIKDHPHLGLIIVDHSKIINTEVRSIILQHHEQHNGRGYPNRLPSHLIYPPAKIVAIADGFCSLISQTSYRETTWTPSEALGILKDDIGHYDPEYLEVFTQMILKNKVN